MITITSKLDLVWHIVSLDGHLLLHLLEVEASHGRAVAVDDLGQLLEGRPLGLDVHEVDEGQLAEDPARVDDVQLPGVRLAERLERDRVGVRVEAQRRLDHDVEDHEALGPQLVRQDLDRVPDQQARPGDRVEEAEQPDEEDHGVVGPGRAVLAVQACAEGPKDEHDEHARGRGEEHRSAAPSVNERGHGNRDNKGQDVLTSGELNMSKLEIISDSKNFRRQSKKKKTTYTELGVRIGNTSLIVQLAGKVGNDGVTRPLREQT